MIQITLSDLVYINEAARALKCSTVMWIQNKLIGLDNLNYVVCCNLDESKLSVLPHRGIIFGQREMAKFMKGMPNSVYAIDDSIINTTVLLASAISPDTASITLSGEMDNIISEKLKTVISYDTSMASYQEENMTDRLSEIYSLNKTDGAMLYKHDSYHILTLFGGLLPLNKADKIYMTLHDNPDNTFLARFRVAKKQFNIFIYIMYISI